MNLGDQHYPLGDFQRPKGSVFHPGDLLMPRTGCPTLCEVITVEAKGLLRIRGMAWDPGYSAEVLAEEMRPVSSILTDSQEAPGRG